MPRLLQIAPQTVRNVAFSWHRTKSLADWRDGMLGMTGHEVDGGEWYMRWPGFSAMVAHGVLLRVSSEASRAEWSAV